MNTRAAILVRAALLGVLLAVAGHGIAQTGNGSLTKDFDKLSAKERSRIAARETREAAEDSNYQAMMQNADRAFQAGRYQEALEAFQQARTLRPYNVYPKVKIQDLQALIRKQADEQAAAAPAPMPIPDTTGPTANTTPTNVAVTSPPAPAPPEKRPAPTRPPSPPAETPPPPMRTPPPAPAAPPTVVDRRPVQTAPAQEDRPATLGERIYMEAGAVVTERTVEDGNRPVVYRKVVHPWGQTFHFKEGHPISGREWDERFNE